MMCGLQASTTQGVTLFKVADGEHVISAVRINESMIGGDADSGDEDPDASIDDAGQE